MKKYLYNPYVIAFVVALMIMVLWIFKTTVTNTIKKISIKTEVKNRENNQAVALVNLQELSDRIYIAFHEYWGGMYEDEVEAMRALNEAGCAANVREMALLYSKKGENLYTDFQKYLSKEQYETVKKSLV